MKAVDFLKYMVCAAMSVAVLAGCGNARESLTVGAWVEAGESVSPQYTDAAGQWDYDATSINEGHGPAVVAGDLVQVNIRDMGQNDDSINDQHKFWLYLGREKGEEANYDFLGSEVGYLGSIRIRRALIRHRVGDKFSLRAPPQKQDRKHAEIIPTKGVIGYGIIPIPDAREKVPPWGRHGAEKISKWTL